MEVKLANVMAVRARTPTFHVITHCRRELWSNAYFLAPEALKARNKIIKGLPVLINHLRK